MSTAPKSWLWWLRTNRPPSRKSIVPTRSGAPGVPAAKAAATRPFKSAPGRSLIIWTRATVASGWRSVSARLCRVSLRTVPAFTTIITDKASRFPATVYKLFLSRIRSGENFQPSQKWKRREKYFFFRAFDICKMRNKNLNNKFGFKE